jgi:hypothetical protein
VFDNNLIRQKAFYYVTKDGRKEGEKMSFVIMKERREERMGTTMRGGKRPIPDLGMKGREAQRNRAEVDRRSNKNIG